MTHTSSPGNPLTLRTEALARHALAHDASHFLMIPEVVAEVRGPEGVILLMEEARRRGQSVTFRSGGTSLSGQASSRSILADTRKGFRKAEVVDEGERLIVEPGVTLRRANAMLNTSRRRLGPDPASEIACTLGGIIANNSSGMSCGIAENSYRTLESAEIILPSGTLIDTSRRGEGNRLARVEPVIYNTLCRIRDQIRSEPDQSDRVKKLFSIKNTMGYSLNAFLDYDDPIDILLRLMVGSEGTLGFVSKAVMKTLPLKRYTRTGLIVFGALGDALAAVPEFTASGADVTELLDEMSLRVAHAEGTAESILERAPISGEAALLVEYRAEDQDKLNELRKKSKALVASLSTRKTDPFTEDAKHQAALWKTRKGLFASVASTRRSGEMSILEDISVPGEQLMSTVASLRELFEHHGYQNTIVFGHARDGNLHFLINQSFESSRDIDKFGSFTDELVEVVLSHDGALKAEHGTGRMMAPYLEAQYGTELRNVMVAIKEAFDPDGLLNPGVILTSNQRSHLEYLKASPSIEIEADRCVECGYCETVCPSKDLTLTPRQRITLRRDIVNARVQGNDDLARELTHGYRYHGIDTCATDGMCAIACPVSIDTGELVRRLRFEDQSPLRVTAWTFAARHWSFVLKTVGRILTLRSRSRIPLFEVASGILRHLFGRRDIPQLSKDLPRGGRARQATGARGSQVLFLASCTGTMFGSATDQGSEDAFLELCERAGVTVDTPSRAESLCCGTPWSSKGVTKGQESFEAQLRDALATSQEIPKTIVSDGSSCAEGYRKLAREMDGIEVVDSISFVRSLLTELRVQQKLPRIVIHPTCSTERAGTTSDLLEIASHLADEVIVPQSWNCCGFAGDRGMLFPELAQSATAEMAEEIRSMRSGHFASCNRTCEIGLSRATGKTYSNILEMLAQQTRA